MKNQHFQSSAFAAFLFKKLFSVFFSTGFPCWNLCLFGGRDLPLSDPFLEWFLMVWATFWLPKPSRRPSRTHPKKTSKFDVYFYRFWAVLATPRGHRKSSKNVRTHLGGTPIFAPKAILLRSGPRGRNFRWFGLPKSQFWLPKRQFWKRFRIIFHMFLGSLLAAALQIARHNVSCNIVSCKTQEQQQQQHQQQQQQQLTCKRW